MLKIKLVLTVFPAMRVEDQTRTYSLLKLGKKYEAGRESQLYLDNHRDGAINE